MRNSEERFGASIPKQDAVIPQQLQSTSSEQTTPLSFIVPTEFVSLPSRGQFYPQHHPLHGKDSVEIKQMTAKEEDILSSKNLLKKGVALDKLIQALVVDKSINTDTLTTEDRNAIIVAARISAYGADYKTTVTCPSCGDKSKHSFDLNEKLEVPDVTESPAQLQPDGNFIVSLPSTKWTVKCRVLNGYDEKEIMRLAEAKKNPNSADSSLTLQLKLMVVSINEVVDRELINDAIDAMPAKDSKFLRNTYQDTVKGIDMRHSYTCKSCDLQTQLEVPLTADFFWFK